VKKHVLIVGGGIGGLSAALCLARCNISSEIIEKASEITEVGAGLQLSPNCSRVLHQLGLESALSKNAVKPESIKIRSWRTGAVLETTTLGAEIQAITGFPYYHIHRADLIAVLLDAIDSESLITLHKGESVTSFSQDADCVSVQGLNGAYEGDVLIGADGLHSTIRSQMFGQDNPVFTGNVAWRFLVPVSQLIDRPVMSAQSWWGPNKHWVHYYVKGGDFVNCVCVVEKQSSDLESWDQRGDVKELRQAFSNWHQDIQLLLRNIDDTSCFKTALYDRRPMNSWSKNRVTLLGDACHPTLPTMAQGAAMSIEDAATISFCINNGGNDPEKALLQYQSLRMQRTASLQQWARRNAKIFHLSGPAAWMRDRLMFLGPASKILEEVYTYNVYANDEPSKSSF
jgi:salicylate hydroxylase